MNRITIGLIPAPLHIAALRLAHWVRLRWWKLAGSRVRGCRVLVLDPHSRVLLIRHSYGSGQWMLPGGGLGRGEDPVIGAVREMFEEVGLRLDEACLVGQVGDALSSHESWLVAGTSSDEPHPDRREVLEARFFAAEDLPEETAPRVKRELPGWITAAKAARPAA
ncbi:NUDIX domain-containing protein [Novosphingobium flavum]|uniref:NUDIX domain-containing protein n=1 Tax=Novosphingobium flavum TaxID=1778672 RepID=A0A7X1FS10_9SPHN|nr:NUDIX domain-containing protein [Novosphingobium flavum]MBC2665913.1 NUDIX domain-containing protein [Novosphingobium flavum]